LIAGRAGAGVRRNIGAKTGDDVIVVSEGIGGGD
jgi:hypothetical protein